MSTAPISQKFEPINPSRVRYIKLGKGGDWEEKCLAQGIIRFGFGTEKPERFELCSSGSWDKLKESLIKDGEKKAKQITNETQRFFEDDGKTLWITFHGGCLWWCFLDSTRSPEPHADGHGVSRKVASAWRSTDINGEPLTNDCLSGALTKLAAYRGTSCNVDKAKYVVGRINGERMQEVQEAEEALKKMKDCALKLIKMLGPRDFEILVDLVFSKSGWERQGPIGGTQKTIDINLMLPSTGETAFVQVKSKTTLAELAEYVREREKFRESKMFYVFHSGEAVMATGDKRVILINGEKIAEMVINAGLINWLIRKVS